MQVIPIRYNKTNYGEKGPDMLRLKVIEILNEQNHTKYWLYKQMVMSYQNLSKLINNETKSIRFDTLERLSDVLNCPIDDLFDRTDASKK